MQKFKINPDGIKILTDKVIKRTVILYVPIFFLLTLYSAFFPGDSKPLIPGWLFTSLVFTLTIFFLLKKTRKNVIAFYDSYLLSLSDTTIVMHHLKSKDVEVSFADVVGITKSKNGSLVIQGKRKSDKILIPSQIDNYFEVDNTIRQKCNALYPKTG